MIAVTAAIIAQENRVLIARRKPGKHLAGYWEFPGGKIEENETAEQCLKRELKEEFLIEVELLEYIGELSFSYPEKRIKLKAFTCKISRGILTLHDHDEIEWVELKEIDKYEMAPADIPLIALYKKYNKL